MSYIIEIAFLTRDMPLDDGRVAPAGAWGAIMHSDLDGGMFLEMPCADYIELWCPPGTAVPERRQSAGIGSDRDWRDVWEARPWAFPDVLMLEDAA
jgi:hypothetical protein